ncbi:MAG: protein kinase [Planctomycetales bacterium]
MADTPAHPLLESDLRTTRFHSAGFEPLELLSRDSLFELWRVRATGTGQLSLWKQPVPHGPPSHTLRQLLAHEERISLQLDSPQVLKILSSSDSSLPSELLFEDFDAASLHSFLLRRGRCSVESTLWIARQIAESLHALERAGFIHASLNPHSLLVHRSGQIKLTNLILAQRLGRSCSIDLSTEWRSDPEIQSYRSPERTRSSYSARIAWDLYALGVLMYRLLTGKLPWIGSTPEETDRLQRTTNPVPIRQLAPHVPRDVAEFVAPLLSRQPIYRPDSWQQVIDRLVALEIQSLPATG